MDISSAAKDAGAIGYACPHCRRAAWRDAAAYVCGACERRFPVGRAYRNFLLGHRTSEIAEQEKRHRNRQAREYERRKVLEKGRLYFRLHKRLVTALLGGAPPGPLLDAGCGTGLVTQDLCGPRREIMALDFSEASLE